MRFQRPDLAPEASQAQWKVQGQIQGLEPAKMLANPLIKRGDNAYAVAGLSEGLGQSCRHIGQPAGF
jgi:hypothetical protein